MENDMKRHSDAHLSSAGFSLVEMMVALVIGLVATLIIMQMFMLSESRKRTSTGGADAQTNAAVSLYLMERDFRQAGYGLTPNTEDYTNKFTYDPVYAPPPTGWLRKGILVQCAKVHAYNKLRATTQDFLYDNFTFAPLLINPKDAANTTLIFPAGDANTDVILVNYSGASGTIGKGVDITTGSNSQNGGNVPDYVAVSARTGFSQGDMVLAVPPAGSGADCTLGEITGLPVLSGTTQCSATITGAVNLINHNDLAYKSFDDHCADRTAQWNKSGGSGVIYSAGSKLYNLGPVGTFVSRAYAIRAGNLTMCDLIVNDCTAAAGVTDPKIWTPIAASVVGLKAQYGRDTNRDGAIDQWDTTVAAVTDQAIVAVRIALVARSNQYEKGLVTIAAPLWYKDAATSPENADIDLTATTPSTDDWKHYRYKVVQSIIPLRNAIWGGML